MTISVSGELTILVCFILASSKRKTIEKQVAA